MEKMDKFELQENYDEIDITQLIKTIFLERKLVIIITIIITLLASGFAFYRETKPRSYTASIVLNNKAFNLLLPQDILILNKTSGENEIKNVLLEIQKINMLLETDKVSDSIVSNDILKLSEKEKDSKEIARINSLQYKDLFDFINETIKKEYVFSGNTKDKDFVNIRKDIESKLITLNSSLNKDFKNNLNVNLSKGQKEFADLKKESELINEQIKNLIDNRKIILSNKTLDELSMVDPVLYVKFNENMSSLKVNYGNLQTLTFLLKTAEKENIISLDYKNIEFNGKKISPLLIILAGIILGMGAGMFCALIKAPLIEIFKELKEEKNNQENKKIDLK